MNEEGPTHSCEPWSASLRAPLALVHPRPAPCPHPSPTGLAGHEGKQAGLCPPAAQRTGPATAAKGQAKGGRRALAKVETAQVASQEWLTP